MSALSNLLENCLITHNLRIRGNFGIRRLVLELGIQIQSTKVHKSWIHLSLHFIITAFHSFLERLALEVCKDFRG